MVYAEFPRSDFEEGRNSELFKNCDGVCFFYYPRVEEVPASDKDKAKLLKIISDNMKFKFNDFLLADKLTQSRAYRKISSEIEKIKTNKQLVSSIKTKKVFSRYLGGCFYKFNDDDNLILIPTSGEVTLIRDVSGSEMDGEERNTNPELLAPFEFTNGPIEENNNINSFNEDQFINHPPPFGLVFFSKQELDFYLNFSTQLADKVASSDGVRLVSSYMDLPWNITEIGDTLHTLYTTLAIMPQYKKYNFETLIAENDDGYEIPGASMKFNLSYRLGPSCPPDWRPTLQDSTGNCRIVENMLDFYSQLYSTYNFEKNFLGKNDSEKIKRYVFSNK